MASRDQLQGGRPFVVSATKGDDIGYLEVKEEVSLSLSRFDVSGKEIQKGLKGYVYTERGVWRPETLFSSPLSWRIESGNCPRGTLSPWRYTLLVGSFINGK